MRELLYKRGYGKINQQRIPLTDNAIIEAHLGKFGLVCMEDILHEIYTVGPNFKQASNVSGITRHRLLENGTDMDMNSFFGPSNSAIPLAVSKQGNSSILLKVEIWATERTTSMLWFAK